MTNNVCWGCSTNEQIDAIVEHIMQEENSDNAAKARKVRREKLQGRLGIIDKIIPKLYVDNAEGKLDDDRLSSMVDDLQKESVAIKKELLELSEEAVLTSKSDNYKMFFEKFSILVNRLLITVHSTAFAKK